MKLRLSAIPILVAGPVSCLLASCAPAPTTMDFDFARASPFMSRDVILGHCARFEDLRCVRVAGHPRRFNCTYREWAKETPWPVKSAVIERRGPYDWVFVGGDTPKCSVTVAP